MAIERLPFRLGLPVLLVLGVALWAAAPVFGQAAAPAFRFQTLAPGYPSVSGVLAFGFAPYGAAEPASTPPAPCAMLPDGSSVPGPLCGLVERMFRGSPTFRRQWIRIAEARVRLRITFDHAQIVDGSLARSVVNLGALQAHIQLRPNDPGLPEHLAHEVEHVLEHLDGVDLAQAAAGGLRGVARMAGPTFETRRAIVIGRVVAAEMARFAAGS